MVSGNPETTWCLSLTLWAVISVVLDDTVQDEVVMALINDSFGSPGSDVYL